MEGEWKGGREGWLGRGVGREGRRRERERDGETDRWRDGEIERDRETERQREREIERERER